MVGHMVHTGLPNTEILQIRDQVIDLKVCFDKEMYDEHDRKHSLRGHIKFHTFILRKKTSI